MTFPMMVAVVYLSSKLGQVTGKGLFDVIRGHYPGWVLQSALAGAIIGNSYQIGDFNREDAERLASAIRHGCGQ